MPIATNRELYSAVLRLLSAQRRPGRSLEQFLRTLWEDVDRFLRNGQLYE